MNTAIPKVEVTDNDFLKFHEVQKFGVTNMFDTTRVMELSGLSKEQCLYILANYGMLRDKMDNE